MSAVSSDRLAEVWGVVSSTASTDRIRELEAVLGGLVVVDVAPPPSGATATDPEGPPGISRVLAAVVRALPADASAVAWLGEAPPPVGALVALTDCLSDHDAVTIVVRFSDAIKRVRAGLVIGAVDRDDLCRPTPPVLIRADAARGRLLSALDAGRSPVAALADVGCAVAVTTWAELEPW